LHGAPVKLWKLKRATLNDYEVTRAPHIDSRKSSTPFMMRLESVYPFMGSAQQFLHTLGSKEAVGLNPEVWECPTGERE